MPLEGREGGGAKSRDIQICILHMLMIAHLTNQALACICKCCLLWWIYPASTLLSDPSPPKKKKKEKEKAHWETKQVTFLWQWPPYKKHTYKW